jgi:hypothetical protein
MRQRGRKSADANGVPPIVDGTPLRLQPPHHLTAKEAKLFHEVVTNTPPGQFSASDTYLLVTFVQITALLEDAATRRERQTTKRARSNSRCCPSFARRRLSWQPNLDLLRNRASVQSPLHAKQPIISRVFTIRCGYQRNGNHDAHHRRNAHRL